MYLSNRPRQTVSVDDRIEQLWPYFIVAGLITGAVPSLVSLMLWPLHFNGPIGILYALYAILRALACVLAMASCMWLALGILNGPVESSIVSRRAHKQMRAM